MIKKRSYFKDERECRDMEIMNCNDYIGDIVSSRWVNYLGCYEMTVEFDSKEEVKLFCDTYGYKVSRIGGGDILKRLGA